MRIYFHSVFLLLDRNKELSVNSITNTPLEHWIISLNSEPSHLSHWVRITNRAPLTLRLFYDHPVQKRDMHLASGCCTLIFALVALVR